MPALTTRYGFADTPTPGDASLAWTTLSAQMSGVALTLGVGSVASFPSSVEFDIIVGFLESSGTLSNAERMHVTVVAGTTLTVTRSGALVHAAGESVYHELSTLGLQHSPGAMTDTGDLQYLGSLGRTVRLAAGADGTYLRYASGVPTAGAIQAGDLPAHSAALLTSGTVPLARLSGLTTTEFASAAVSQWTNDAGYLTAAAADALFTTPTEVVAYVGAQGFATLTGLETLTNKTLTTPTIASFANATHTHLNAAGGGTLTAAVISDLGSAAVAFTNKTGNISQWTNDSAYLTAAALATYVVGPAASVDNAIARFDGTTGKLIQDYTSGAPTISDTGVVTIPVSAVSPILYGGVSANGDLTLEGTSHATKTTSYVILQPTGGNVSVGLAVPLSKLHIQGAGGSTGMSPVSANGVTIERGGGSGAFLSFLTTTSGSGTICWDDNVAASGFIEYNHVTDAMRFATSTVTAVTINSSGNVAIGPTGPTAALHLKAGTATASTAPFKFTSGTNLTTAEPGAMEYNGTNLFFTRAGTVRENMLVAIDNVAAPSTSVGVGIVNYYGASATNFLGDPERWLSVNVLGSTYKVPLYN